MSDLQTITILGSTGSIGCNTIKVIGQSKNKYKIEALTAKSNVDLLAKQALEFGAKLAVIEDEALYGQLKDRLAGSGVQAMAGIKAVVEAAEWPSDIVMSAIVGAAGLVPTMAAIKRGAKVALANKECLVCAGDLMMEQVKKTGATLVPVDSEHSAIFQIFDFANPQNIAKIILTASGGPFRKSSLEQMRAVTPQEAVKHPNWSMGSKISIDSATMMNKGLEIIEAYYLFPVDKDRIEVVVHPESIIHSMVEYHDGSTLAQLGTPDMCTPISVALAWPDRINLDTQKLDLLKVGQLNFEAVDGNRFPAIALAKQALADGGAMPAVFNSANEVAVAAFLNGKIGFLDIARLVEEEMQISEYKAPASIDDVLAVIDLATTRAKELVAGKFRLAC